MRQIFARKKDKAVFPKSVHARDFTKPDDDKPKYKFP